MSTELSEPAAQASTRSTQTEAPVAVGKGRQQSPGAGGGVITGQRGQDRSSAGRRSRSQTLVPERVLSEPDQIRRVVKELASRGASHQDGGEPAVARIDRLTEKILAGKESKDRIDANGNELRDAVQRILEGR